jgi:hypothetical protein
MRVKAYTDPFTIEDKRILRDELIGEPLRLQQLDLATLAAVE